MKRWFSIILVVMLCISVLAIPANAAGGQLSVSNDTVKRGDTVTVNISSSSTEFAFLKLVVGFDSDAVSVVECKSHISGIAFVSEGGTLVWSNADNVSVNGIIASVTFKVADNASKGAHPISISMAECYDADLNDVSIGNASGTITVDVPHVHGEDVTAVSAKAATCTEAGNREYYVCGCGKLFADSACTSETTLENVTIKALGHKWGDWKVTKEPSCADGEKERVCERCGERETEVIDATGAHKWGEWKVTTPAACEKKGTQTRTCDLCGETESKTNIPALGHDFGDWVKVDDNNHQRTCKRTGCDKTETAAHAWDKVDHKDPTCKDDGYDRFQCPDCNAVKTTYIKSTGDHGFNTWTDNGDGKTHTSVCDGCGLETKTEDHTWDKVEVTKEPTCTAKGVKTFTCKCGAAKTEDIPATGVHTYENGKWEKNDAETHKMKCDHCDTYKTEKHNWDKGVVTEQPTCSKEGTKVYTCKDCKETKKEVLSATGEHDYTAKYEKVDEKTHKAFCACGEGIEEEHKKSTFIKVIRKPTTSEKGLELWACVCGHEMEIETPAISGNYDKVPKTGDITGQVILLCISAVAVMAGAVYGIKRKTARQK